MKALILCGDRYLQELLEEVYSDYELEFISDPHLLQDTSQMKGILAHDSFDILLVTNFCIPMAVAMNSVGLIPDVRTYRAVMFTSYFTEEVGAICAARGVDVYSAPMSLEELRQALR